MGLFGKKKDEYPPLERVSGSSHGDHWRCITDDKEKVMIKIERTFKNEGKGFAIINWTGYNIDSKKIQKNETIGIVSQDKDLKLIILTTNGTIWTAYPYPISFTKYPVQVSKVMQWPNMIEGWINFILPDYGASLNYFDSYFFTHHGKIPTKATIKLSAIGYKMKIAKEHKFEVNRPGIPFKEATTKGACWILPVGEKGASIDDYNVQMPVKEVKEIDIWGEKGYIFFGPVIQDNIHEPFILPIIILEKHIDGPIPIPGDDLNAFIWLQGCVDLDTKS